MSQLHIAKIFYQQEQHQKLRIPPQPMDVTLVTFEVHARTSLGETLCVCGDHGELGAFVRQAARELVTDPASYPIWRTSVLLPKGVPFQYKYMITEFTQFQTWEPIQARYRTFVPRGEAVIVRDEYGAYDEVEALMQAAREEAGMELVSPTPPSVSATPDFTFQPNQPAAASGMPPLPPAAALAANSGSRSRKLVKKSASEAGVQKRLLLIAFHLPLKMRLKAETELDEVWEAEWDPDNVVAKSEDSVADEMQVTWVGAVTPANVFDIEHTFDPSEKRKAGITLALKAFNCIPVFLTQEVYNLHYVQCSKNLLWDIFHNVQRTKSMAVESSYEMGYVPGNSSFASVAMPYLKKTDICWVHDYHLMLVPGMLRARGHEGPIIFFLHVPFPTSEIFRTLPMRHELLEGMLASSTIGFHTFNHGRHFLTACRRFLGAQSRSAAEGTLAVEYHDRRVLITISHLGVDPKRITKISTAEHTTEEASRMIRDLPTFMEGLSIKLPAKEKPEVVFGSLDELQRLKGVPLKLLAFERFLSTTPKWQNGKARFILWAIKQTGGARQHDNERSAREVRRLVQRINEAYGPVVLYTEFDSKRPPTLDQRVALWLATDVFVSTAVSEGLNLMPLEFLFSRPQINPGVVIISEFSASSSVLNGAVRVNCYDIAFIAKAMDETARMPLEERMARRARDVDYISAKSSEWTRHIINEVLTALDDETFTTIEQVPDLTNSGVALPHTVQCKPLRCKDVVRACAAASRRVFFLDFGGTLVEREQENLTLKRDFLGAMGRGLSDQMRSTLERLCRDEERNVVFIVSGDTRTVLTRVFFDLLKQGVPLGLVAHSGLCIRMPKKDFLRSGSAHFDDQESQLSACMSMFGEQTFLDNVWATEKEKNMPPSLSGPLTVRSYSVAETGLGAETTEMQQSSFTDIPLPDLSSVSAPVNSLMSDWIMTVDVAKEWSHWMRESGIFPILKKYTWATGGTSYRTSAVTTVWDYTFADPEWGASQAQFLTYELETAISKANLNIVVKHTKSTVQLLPINVDKGSAVRRVLSSSMGTLRPNWNGQEPDFCLCMGDDISDELMFGAVHQHFTSIPAMSLLSLQRSGSSSASVATTAGNDTPPSGGGGKRRVVFTATVGRKPTKAAYYLRDVEAVKQLLMDIVDANVA